ncbi:MAG TPA: GNAT family N-acetyltransferase [Microlunatus sp.]|nr:GNAT family N-acetyltransferase [Microlunatus sp.]
MTTLADLLARIERGEKLPTEPWLSVVPPAGNPAVLSFPGRIVIAADLDPAWVFDQIPDGDLSAPLNPPFLHACERKLGRRVNSVDALLLAPPASGPPPLALREAADLDHPRVRRARRYRPRVRIFTVDGGVLVVGQGLAGRWEAAIEVDPAARGRGLGRTLAAAARHLVPAGRPVWAQVNPGNAASVRAFLAAGYRPVGAEALLVG